MCALSARLSPHDLFAPLVFVFRSWYKLFVPQNVTPLARRLQEARKSKGLSRAQLAVAAQSTEAAVRMWETGRRHPRMPYLIRIAAATDREVSWFFEEVAA